MSNIKLSDFGHSNNECQNFLNVKLFNVRHLNVRHELFEFRLQMLNVKRRMSNQLQCCHEMNISEAASSRISCLRILRLCSVIFGSFSFSVCVLFQRKVSVPLISNQNIIEQCIMWDNIFQGFHFRL